MNRKVEDQSIYLTTLYKDTKISVYNEKLEKTYVHGKGKEINVLIYGSHTFALLPRLEKFKYNMFRRKHLLEQKTLKLNIKEKLLPSK